MDRGLSVAETSVGPVQLEISWICGWGSRRTLLLGIVEGFMGATEPKE